MLPPPQRRPSGRLVRMQKLFSYVFASPLHQDFVPIYQSKSHQNVGSQNLGILQETSTGSTLFTFQWNNFSKLGCKWHIDE